METTITDRDLGLAVKALRELFLLTQQEVSDYLGIHRTAIVKMENGLRSVSAIEIAKLAGLFGVHPSEFYRLAELRSESTKEG